jgi:xanthine dehydrogenase accessory factor
MNLTQPWLFLSEKLSSSQHCLLLYVLESIGSSPGRRGFMMAVAADGTFTGTIGGGIMEYKLVEKAKADLLKGHLNLSTIQQHHDKAHGTDQSGMICSGSQRVAFVPLGAGDAPLIQAIAQAIENRKPVSLGFSPLGMELLEGATSKWKYENEANWQSVEPLTLQPVVHIVGGGHVALALSEQLHWLGFYIHVYDNRPNLSTLEYNQFAHEKHLVDYEDMGKILAYAANDFVVIMTVGYRTDKLVLKQLLHLPFYYLGMLGSERKVAVLLEELRNEGATPAQIARIFTPIGLPIYSQTTHEIAVSIAAEIIREKNKNLPSGRTKA